jgi:TRAP-type uncharacterized transport system substrate-binding protein
MKGWAGRLRTMVRSPRVVLGLAIVMIGVTIVTAWLASRTPELHLRVTAGDRLSRRHEIATVLQRLCRERGLVLEIEPTSGSALALERVGRRQLDVALVQGGLEAGPSVREVAPLAIEPLHLLVRDPARADLTSLRGGTVHLGPPGSGTRELSLDVLRLAGLHLGREVHEQSRTYDELFSMPEEELPDAVFHVSSLPSPVAQRLIDQRGYHLVPLPYSGALHLHNVAVRPATIPGFTYGVDPPMPPADALTPGTRMLIVAHEDTDPEAIRRLLDAIGSEELARITDLSPFDREALATPELPLHPAAQEWLRRNDALLTPEIIDNVESMRSFLVSLVVALFLLWRWIRARQQRGFDAYLNEVTKLEREILHLESQADLDLHRLVVIQRALGEIKNRALVGYGEGQISSADLLNSFLAHVTDVRTNLNALILHERERLEKVARSTQGGDQERRDLWRHAMGEDDGG